MARWTTPRKYDPLGGYLEHQRTDRVTLTLTEIETILGTSLPALATWSPFWSNYEGNYVARAWRRVGWRVAKAHRTPAVAAVTFVRASSIVPA